MEQTNLIALAHSVLSLYAGVCKPVCRELGIPQTAFDILMLLTNEPKCQTARDISQYSGIKKNLVSMHVETLVQQGYLQREEVPGDRRQVKLVVTGKAAAVVDKGRRVQQYYHDFLIKGLPPEELAVYRKCMAAIAANAEELNSLLLAGTAGCE